MFGDRQFSILYDIRDRLPEASWRPALERVGSRSQWRILAYYAGTVAVWAFGTVPTTFVGVGVTIFSPGFEVEQPPAARSSGSRIATGNRRRTSAQSIALRRR